LVPFEWTDRKRVTQALCCTTQEFEAGGRELPERVVHDCRKLNRAENRRSKSCVFLPTILEG
jgi:hypothetical protein